MQDIWIGNLLYDDNGDVCRVVHIYKSYMDLKPLGPNTWVRNHWPQYANPIPLTEDWILKAGFEKDGRHHLFIFSSMWYIMNSKILCFVKGYLHLKEGEIINSQHICTP